MILYRHGKPETTEAYQLREAQRAVNEGISLEGLNTTIRTLALLLRDKVAVDETMVSKVEEMGRFPDNTLRSAPEGPYGKLWRESH